MIIPDSNRKVNDRRPHGEIYMVSRLLTKSDIQRGVIAKAPIKHTYPPRNGGISVSAGQSATGLTNASMSRSSFVPLCLCGKVS